MAVKRSRKFSLVSYVPAEHILQVLQSHSKSIRGFAYATHDKDLNDDGTSKAIHTHIVLWLYDTRSLDDIRRWFKYVDSDGQAVNTLGQFCLDISSAYEYLTHQNASEKYQYSHDIVVCTDESLFENASEVNEDSALGALTDLLNGVPLRVVAEKYGRDFIFHYSHIKLLIDDILRSGVSNG